jgi:hypothetical protein
MEDEMMEMAEACSGAWLPRIRIAAQDGLKLGSHFGIVMIVYLQG